MPSDSNSTISGSTSIANNMMIGGGMIGGNGGIIGLNDGRPPPPPHTGLLHMTGNFFIYLYFVCFHFLHGFVFKYFLVLNLKVLFVI